MHDDTQCGDGAVQRPLPNLRQRTHEVQDDQRRYRFGNGRIIKTESFRKPDRLRSLPWGTPRGEPVERGWCLRTARSILLMATREQSRPEQMKGVYV
jgi:hypothetical protein